uniref:Uncharacterized protein n=1 Tax=Ditylenchus dipsaci TaxID=166011 RepID=A0A915E9D5_9BILA
MEIFQFQNVRETSTWCKSAACVFCEKQLPLVFTLQRAGFTGLVFCFQIVVLSLILVGIREIISLARIRRLKLRDALLPLSMGSDRKIISLYLLITLNITEAIILILATLLFLTGIRTKTLPVSLFRIGTGRAGANWTFWNMIKVLSKTWLLLGGIGLMLYAQACYMKFHYKLQIMPKQYPYDFKRAHPMDSMYQYPITNYTFEPETEPQPNH